MCRHTREPTVLSRLSCRPPHLNVDRFHQPCLLPWRVPLLPPIHGWLGQGQVRTVVPVPRSDHSPFLGSPVLPPSRLTGSIATPTRRYHGRMLIHPSLPACATPHEKVTAHTQVRDPRESAAACLRPALGTPSPWPSHAIFVRFQGGAFPQTTFACPSAWRAFPLISRALAINDLAWM